jgi:hypothetical protein
VHLTFVLNNALGLPADFQGHRPLLVASRFLPKRSARAFVSSGLKKQKITNSVPSRHISSSPGATDFAVLEAEDPRGLADSR